MATFYYIINTQYTPAVQRLLRPSVKPTCLIIRFIKVSVIR